MKWDTTWECNTMALATLAGGIRVENLATDTWITMTTPITGPDVALKTSRKQRKAVWIYLGVI